MARKTLLTTTEVAELAAVTPSTVKRWADQGTLPTLRTAGGHRRFDPETVRRVLGPLSEGGSDTSAWVACLVRGQRHEIDARLLEARARLGSWAAVGDELMRPLGEMGRRWRAGLLAIADEHLASEALSRALARMGDMLPTRPGAPVALLACAPEDDHTLGLATAELCLRELGWQVRWLGRRTPSGEVERIVAAGEVALVVLVASAASRRATLATYAGGICRAAAERGVPVVLGGAGPWPERPRHAVHLTTFVTFAERVRRLGA